MYANFSVLFTLKSHLKNYEINFASTYVYVWQLARAVIDETNY